ncbi:cas scaffolding protein family member 4 [Perognathus longimembris pacificus]|uniref:cas scaffolding protein family member 4 n=1 Tax=Perognathus longimembris pacificus TaxID=214514 RepID=UPI0020197418|nr:cas scaffolding protein family member 4 [Perognathus longimembris pacificus]
MSSMRKRIDTLVVHSWEFRPDSAEHTRAYTSVPYPGAIHTQTDPSPQILLARALYDNLPDCCDELAFSRGDILTVLEQNVPESEGWWKCLLHGRQGLAPANRLLVLPEGPPDRPCAPFPTALEEDDLPGSEGTYEVPTPRRPPLPGPVYEPMKSWVPATAQAYELPEPPSGARVVCEKTLSFPKQALFVLPRPTRASLSTLSSQVYDVPPQSRVHSTLKEPEKQPLYDIPTSPQKAALHAPVSHANGQSVALTAAPARGRTGCSTLPNPQKPQTCDKAALRQKNASLPDVSPYPSAAPRDSHPSAAGVHYKVPSSFLAPRVEQQNTTPNIYDIPKVAASALQAGREPPGHKASRLSGKTTSPSPEPHRLSVSSSDSSRASTMSSCSSASTDSSASSSSEPPKELPLDLDSDTAKETAITLQREVIGAATGLLLFVNRKWRSRDSLEANVHAIHRAADGVEESLRRFLDFAQGVGAAACSLTDSHLQARIQAQLQTISNSYQILLDAKGSLDSCKWSPDTLGMDKVQNSPDDLERFVMVARMVPEDVKRFASIVIANARLLFTQNWEKAEPVRLVPRAVPTHGTCTRLPHGEIELGQQKPFHRQKENQVSAGMGKRSGTAACGQGPSPLVPQPWSQQSPERKIRLSEHCRLYFGALFKAISVFTSSLNSSPAPEVFVAQSKLVIVVGQKLVDALCAETREKDVRNEVLCRSSRLCGLLRDLALATKRAVLQHPSPAALEHLRAGVRKLEDHAQHFRGTLE